VLRVEQDYWTPAEPALADLVERTVAAVDHTIAQLDELLAFCAESNRQMDERDRIAAEARRPEPAGAALGARRGRSGRRVPICPNFSLIRARP
jgi:hypothetical protein